MKRIYSIDVTRGLVMIIMAIDHMRDLMHSASLTHDPLDFNTTTPAIFFTRWITHLCAPIFVFLSGTSAYLSYKKTNDLKQSRTFLITRGVWLIILEFTIITFAVWWDYKFRTFLFQVIATIGFGFIILSFLMKLKPRTILMIGLVIIALHDLLTTSTIIGKSPFRPLFTFSAIPLPTSRLLIIAYPIIPWLGIMLAGFGAGFIFTYDQSRRRKLFLQISLISLATFVILRFANIYGDPSVWTTQKNSVFTFMSVMNVSKYPPSLLYTLVMLGIMFFVLYLVEGVDNFLTRILRVYGNVPLFYYLIHWYFIHLLMFLMLYLQGFHTSDFFPTPQSFGRPTQPNGVSLPVLYLIWAALMIALYPLCLWYGRFKNRHPEIKWLRYL